MTGWAFISDDGVYRYSLTRDLYECDCFVPYLDGVGNHSPSCACVKGGTVTFVMLNPSTADGTIDDPTIRKCIKFAKTWSFARLKVVNLYALRATNPRELHKARDPVGPENDCTISKVVGGSDLVVCAWGSFKENRSMVVTPRGRAAIVLSFIGAPHCLRLSKDGNPWHPLYIPDVTLPQPFAHCPPQAVWTP